MCFHLFIVKLLLKCKLLDSMLISNSFMDIIQLYSQETIYPYRNMSIQETWDPLEPRKGLNKVFVRLNTNI